MKKIAFVLTPFAPLQRQIFPEEKRFWDAQWLRRTGELPVGNIEGSLSSMKDSDSRLGVPFDWPEVPVTPLLLIAYLIEKDRPVSIVDFYGKNRIFMKKTLHKLVDGDGIEIFLFSTFTSNYSESVFCAKIIKKLNPEAICIVGGPHVSGLHGQALDDGFDIVIVGEGEQALAYFAEHGFDKENWQHIPNAMFRTMDGEISINQNCYPLGSRPLPAYHMLPERYRKNYYARLFTSNGCPYNCIFCSGTLWNKKEPVFKTSERVHDELSLIRENINFDEIYIGDETFTFRQEHTKKMADLLKSEGVVWGCETRVDLIDKDILSYLNRAGCVEIDFGIESLDEDILVRTKKNIKRKQIENALHYSLNAGIRLHANLMLGLPGETADTAKRTVDQVAEWLSKGLINTVDYFITVPYPGSPLFQRPTDFGLKINTDDWALYREDDLPVFDLETLRADEIFHLWREGLTKLSEGMS